MGTASPTAPLPLFQARLLLDAIRHSIAAETSQVRLSGGPTKFSTNKSNLHHVAVTQKTGTNMEPWEVESWTTTCITPPA